MNAHACAPRNEGERRKSANSSEIRIDPFNNLNTRHGCVHLTATCRTKVIMEANVLGCMGMQEERDVGASALIRKSRQIQGDMRGNSHPGA